ncbi:MAG: hypothetical protein AMXMBFR84_25010 [Candidatus Hydrogenedentota bacterium]
MLPGCANQVWLCEACGNAIVFEVATVPRQKFPTVSPVMRCPAVVDNELLCAQRERLESKFGTLLRIPGPIAVPKIVRVYGVLYQTLGLLTLIGCIAYFSRYSAAVVLGDTTSSLPWLGAVAGAGTAASQWMVGRGLIAGRRWAYWGGVVFSLGYAACLCWVGSVVGGLPMLFSFAAAFSLIPIWVSLLRKRRNKVRHERWEHGFVARTE